MNILFVCTGNTCRSPMAEGIMKLLLKNKNLAEVYVSSAGVAACDGLYASTNAQIAALGRGADISLHSSRQANGNILSCADLVLCMTPSHKSGLCSAFPQFKDKIFTLPEYVCSDSESSPPEIADPFGCDIQVYEKCAADIEYLLVLLLEKLEADENTQP